MMSFYYVSFALCDLLVDKFFIFQNNLQIVKWDRLHIRKAEKCLHL